jgi:hypothetical protein
VRAPALADLRGRSDDQVSEWEGRRRVDERRERERIEEEEEI